MDPSLGFVCTGVREIVSARSVHNNTTKCGSTSAPNIPTPQNPKPKTLNLNPFNSRIEAEQASATTRPLSASVPPPEPGPGDTISIFNVPADWSLSEAFLEAGSGGVPGSIVIQNGCFILPIFPCCACHLCRP